MVDAVAGRTLVDTLGYVNGLIEAAKAASSKSATGAAGGAFPGGLRR